VWIVDVLRLCAVGNRFYETTPTSQRDHKPITTYTSFPAFLYIRGHRNHIMILMTAQASLTNSSGRTDLFLAPNEKRKIPSVDRESKNLTMDRSIRLRRWHS
jgi:hypothetical protein